MRQPPAKPRPGLYAASHVDGHGTRYIVILPEPDAAYLAEWVALNEKHGIHQASVFNFITDTKNSSH